MIVTHFRQLRVYQAAFEAAMKLFELTKSWPKEERYSMTDQIRRSSRSVSTNMSESWRKRRYQAHFVSKLSDADAEAAETQGWIDYALACKYISESEFKELDEAYETISGGLVKMMSNAEQWCGPSHLVKEDQAEYGSPSN